MYLTAESLISKWECLHLNFSQRTHGLPPSECWPQDRGRTRCNVHCRNACILW